MKRQKRQDKNKKYIILPVLVDSNLEGKNKMKQQKAVKVKKVG